MTERKNIYWMIILLMFLIQNVISQSKLTTFKCDKHLIYDMYGGKSFYEWWVDFYKNNPNIKPGKLKIIKS